MAELEGRVGDGVDEGMEFKSTPRTKPNVFHDLLEYGEVLDKGEIVILWERDDLPESRFYHKGGAGLFEFTNGIMTDIVPEDGSIVIREES